MAAPGRGVPLAAVLSIVGLVVIAFATLSLTSGNLPFVPGSVGQAPGSTANPGTVTKTPTPVNVVVVPTEVPGIEVPGTLLYAKDGNIWIQANGEATQLTSGGTRLDALLLARRKQRLLRPHAPTRTAAGRWAASPGDYQMDVPSLMSVPVTGGDATRVLDGLVDPPGSLKWMGFIQEPVLAPDGRTMAMASDLPNPTHERRRHQDLRPQDEEDHRPPPRRRSRRSATRTRPGVRTGSGSPTSATTATGPRGCPGSTCTTRRRRRPARSRGPGTCTRPGRPTAGTWPSRARSAFGTDVVILNASTGAELLRLTDSQGRRQLGARLVAQGRPDRLPARGGPGRRPPDGAARRHRPDVDGQGHAST